MKLSSLPKAHVLLLVLCLFVGLDHASHAETLSEVINPQQAQRAWVSDMAHVLDAATERRLNNLSTQLEQRTTAEIAVVTIRRTDGSSPKQFSTALFNRWGIGKRSKNNGVLMVLVMDAHRIELETGRGMSRVLPDAQVQEILNERVIPRFKEDDYNGGVLAGAQALAQEITDDRSKTATAPVRPARHRVPQPLHSGGVRLNPRSGAPAQVVPPDSSPFSVAPPPSFTSPFSSGPSNPFGPISSFGWLPVAFVALLLPLAGWAAWRSSIRRCPNCSQPMRRLSESEDDALLAFDQKFEEDLGSVDYVVWRCDACRTSKVERAAKWFSSYEDCPQCRHRTVFVQSDVVRHADYDWEGESIVTRTCRFPGCGFQDRQRRTIPRLTRPTPAVSHHTFSDNSSSSISSSSVSSTPSHHDSGGSFGGGSSSGGGAGASW